MKSLTHKIIISITMIVVAAVLVTSCNKNDMTNTIKPNKNVNVIQSRLKFNSLNAFANTIKEMKANPNVKPEEILERILGEENYSRFKNKMKEGSINVTDTLVDDPAFASVLNSKGEVQVDSTTYRITPYGTFMYLPDKENQVDQKISELEKGNTIPETEQQPYLYKVDDGVYRYATFVEAGDNTGDYSGGGANSSGGNTTSNTQKDIETHTISNAKTVVGNFIRDKFGFIATYYRYFDSNHRIRFKFSSPNFVLFSYIMVKVKFQKKGWTGAWYKTTSNKMVLGWDGMTYEYKDAIPTPQNAKIYSSYMNN